MAHGGYVATDPTDTRVKPKLSHFRFFTMTIAFLGIQFGWAIQIAFTTPLFLTLGVTHTAISLIWLAGPISGLFVQPIVGAVSDAWYTRWGRRSPFIFVGGICIVLGLALVSNAAPIGSHISSKHGHSLSIVIAVIGFWVLDLANNTVQGPCRALLVDIAPPEQQGLGSSWFSFMLGTGNLVGYFVGSLNLLKIVPFMGTQYRALFTASMIILAICIAITLATTKEHVDTTPRKIENPFKTIFKGIRNMPSPVARVCVVQFFAWVGWFTYILFITDWVGEEIYHGVPTDPTHSPGREAYDNGVRMGSRALTYNAGVTMACSIVLPKITQYVGTKKVYFVGQIILAACLISTPWIKNIIGASFIIALCGVPWTVTMVLPFTIIGQGVSTAESGLYMGVLNIFIVLPQIAVSLFIPIVIRLFGHKVVAALVTGGISSLIAAAFTFRLITPSFDKADTEETRPLVNKTVDESGGAYSTN